MLLFVHHIMKLWSSLSQVVVNVKSSSRFKTDETTWGAEQGEPLPGCQTQRCSWHSCCQSWGYQLGCAGYGLMAYSEVSAWPGPRCWAGATLLWPAATM